MTLGAILTVAVVSTAKVMQDESSSGSDAKVAEKKGVASPHTGQHPQPSGMTPPDWTTKLYNATCADDCVGGLGCSASGNKPCPSKFTCITGTKEDHLETELPLNLHLSGLIPHDANVSFCSLNVIVCFKPASTQALTCIPLSDACSHEGRSSESVAVQTRDLVSSGVGISVHLGSTNTPPIATGSIRYGTPISRVGLCSGFIVGGLSNTSGLSIKYVSYFLEPRQ